MSTFLVLYLAPAAGLEEWMKTDPEVRKVAEEKMKSEWDAWMSVHGSAIKETAGAGKTKRVTPDGIEDTKNDLMLYSMVEAESHEAAAALFKDHPHFGIPNATIEVMPANFLPGMEK